MLSYVSVQCENLYTILCNPFFICLGIGLGVVQCKHTVNVQSFVSPKKVTFHQRCMITEHSISCLSLQDAIMRLMYYEFGFSALILLIIIIYFPTRPPKPPSISASIERLDYK